MRATLILLSTLTALVLAEGLFRLHYLLTYAGGIKDLHEQWPGAVGGQNVVLGPMLRPSPYPDVVYELKTGLDVTFIGAPVRTNAEGLREEPLDRTKPAGTIRLLGIGDSIMFGWGVAVEERYMYDLERRLNEARPEASWQAVVTAVPGYNLVMEVESLRRYGLAYEPDLVVYGWHSNDVCLPNFLQNRRDVLSLRPFGIDYLRGFAWGAPQLLPRARLAPGSACLDDDVPEQYRHLAGHESFARALEELAALGAEEEIPVVMVSHILDSYGGKLPAGILHVEPRQRGAGLPAADLQLSLRDTHPTPLAHRLIAEALFEDLETRGVWRELTLATQDR